MSGGRPEKFQEAYIHQVWVACKRGGLSKRNIAEMFGVSPQTITNWCEKYPDFADAIRDGQSVHKVEAALLKRARGFSFTEVTQELVKVPGGRQLMPTKKVRKHVAPDVGAARFVLSRLDPERWPDKQQVDVNASGAIQISWEDDADD